MKASPEARAPAKPTFARQMSSVFGSDPNFSPFSDLTNSFVPHYKSRTFDSFNETLCLFGPSPIACNFNYFFHPVFLGNAVPALSDLRRQSDCYLNTEPIDYTSTHIWGRSSRFLANSLRLLVGRQNVFRTRCAKILIFCRCVRHYWACRGSL